MRKWQAVVALLVLLGGIGGIGGAVVLRDQGGTGLPFLTPTASPEPVRTPLFPATAGTARPTRAGLARALAATLEDPGLGRRVGLSVLDAETGEPLLEVDARRAVTPASTAKIVTALAVLKVLEPEARLSTRVVQGANGDVVLVGGGDPTLAGRHAVRGFPRTARLVDLASQVKGVAVTRVVVDDTLFTGPLMGPGWKRGYVTNGDVAPVSALMVDGGRTSSEKNQPRSADPALEAGRQLAALLKVKVVVRGAAAAGAVELARVESPTMSELVEVMLTRSDNDLAEALGRHVALAAGLPATFDGEVAATVAALGPLLDAAKVGRGGLGLRDASGLSPHNRLQPAALTRLLALVGQDGRYAPLLSGLPVAGFDGTLQKRFREAPSDTAAGLVRAKTGTLNGVSALAGLVRTRSGHLLAFDLTADGVSLSGTLEAQAALDRLAAVLASCGCT